MRGLPVPKDAHAILADDGLPVAIVEKMVAGEPVTVPLRGTRRVRLARQLGSFLTDPHAFPVSEARSYGVASAPAAVEARRNLDLARPYLTDSVLQWLDREVSALERQELQQAVVHRDVRAQHLYVNSAGDLVGVIDFGDATEPLEKGV